MPFEIIRNDITNMRVDAIVNTANPRPLIGSGVDAAVHAKAGPGLLEARREIGSMHTGEACVTPGFRLPSKYVIHTVGPVWEGGSYGEAHLLRQCYENSLKLALRNGCASVAFPLISTGNYGFPKKLALEIAVETIRAFLEEHEMQVYLVVFGKASLELSGGLVDHVRSFVDEAYVRERERMEYSFSGSRDFDFVRERLRELEKGLTHSRSFESEEAEREGSCAEVPPEWDLTEDDRSRGSTRREYRREGRERTAAFHEEIKSPKTPFDPEELGRMLKKTDLSFSEMLLKLIDQSGEKDADVYKRANVDRKLFSKIRNNPQYKPSKTTAVAFAIALKLDLEKTRDFIGRAGYALSRSNQFDIIIEYFILHERYDIYEINLMLFEFDQMLLGT